MRSAFPVGSWRRTGERWGLYQYFFFGALGTGALPAVPPVGRFVRGPLWVKALGAVEEGLAGFFYGRPRGMGGSLDFKLERS